MPHWWAGRSSGCGPSPQPFLLSPVSIWRDEAPQVTSPGTCRWNYFFSLPICLQANRLKAGKSGRHCWEAVPQHLFCTLDFALLGFSMSYLAVVAADVTPQCLQVWGKGWWISKSVQNRSGSTDITSSGMGSYNQNHLW